MLSKDEIDALSVCVGSAIGEFGVSETTDLAMQAITKLKAAQQTPPTCPDCGKERIEEWVCPEHGIIP